MPTNDPQAKIKEIIALNTERHTRLQEEEEFEAYYRENILQLLDDIVLQVAEERSHEASTVTGPGQKAPLSTAMRDFFARFEGTYESLMAAMFPGLTLGADAMAVRGGTRSGTVDPGAGGTVAPQGQAQPGPLTPAEEEARARLPVWVVVPYASALLPGTAFAILWAGEGEAPDLPPLELRLDGQPWDENVFWPEVRSNVAGLPPGDVTFVKFDELKPRGFTIIQSEDGGLVVDFTMT